jgi:hypothetical protein
VSAATVPEVLLAAAKARLTVVLLGDFLQLGPVLPREIRRSDRPDVQQWLLQDCFGIGGITTAENATQHPGCAVLDAQYRFGPDLTALANLGPYAGTLRMGYPRPRNPEDPEIVVIDTDGLDDLGIVRRLGPSKGWWPAGSLLARVLAQHHLTEGEDGQRLVNLRRGVSLRLEPAAGITVWPPSGDGRCSGTGLLARDQVRPACPGSSKEFAWQEPTPLPPGRR